MATISSSRRAAPDLTNANVYRYLVDSVQDYAIFMLDPEGYITTWNPGAQRFKGYTAGEIIGKHFSIFYPEKDLQAGKPAMELTEATRIGRYEDEGWRLRKDGSRFWANVVITRIVNEQGQLLGFSKITRDLTERREAEGRYRLLVEAVTDYAIYSLDAQGFITSWNSGAERIKGYKASEIIGKHFSNFYTPEEVAAGVPAHVLQVARDEGHFVGEGWRLRKDGTRFWSSVALTALRDEEGTLTGFSKITRDISDRRELLEKIHQHARELEMRVMEREQTNAELEAFSYSVSHDLRSPLRAITGFAEALREEQLDKLDADGKEYLQQIIDAAGRMNRLIQDLLNYGRISRGEMQLATVPLKPLVQGVAKRANTKAGQVRVRVPAEAEVKAHEATLEQALVNLVDNALKFQRPGELDRVEIIAERRPHGSWRLTVSDHGIGIAAHHQERIFRVFERLHGIEDYPGTGIGLAIVKRSVNRMGGEVGVESELGKGSSFWIELPAA
jgi:PAS domain S-box-containing protein